jgi:hypothetical protein
MRWFIRAAAMLVVIGLALPLSAQDAKKADDKKADEKKDDHKKDDEKDKKDKLLPAGTVPGKITNWNEDKRVLKVEITYHYQKLNDGEAKAYQDSVTAYQKALASFRTAGTPQQRNQAVQDANKAQQDMATHLSKVWTMEKKTQEMEFSILDDAKIRTANPPIVFDDDGKPKKFSKAELDKLKGDTKTPGYPAEIDVIATGAQVQLTLVKKKDAKPTKDNTPTGVPKPKDYVNPDVLADHLPLVSVVVVLPVEEKK